MPQEDTFGRLLVSSALPPGVPRPTTPLDKKTVSVLYQALAQIAPDRFRDATKKLSDLGAEAGYLTGGYSFGPEHLRPTPAVETARRRMADEVRAVLADTTLTDQQRADKLVHVGLRHAEPLLDAVKTSTGSNPLALQVTSGAKGKFDNVKSLMAGDTLYSDSDYNPVPFPVTHSFYEGLRPHEYAAGTFGARLVIVLTKLGTASVGYLAKRMRGTTHRLVVTAPDDDAPDPNDPPTGLKTTLDDHDNEGAALARDVGGFKRNTVLTRSVIADLKRQGVRDVYVRSPIVGGPADGGVYGHDVGVRERGGIAPVGDQVGLAAADALCLARGTRVRMADGTVKAIEDISIGDTVLGSDANGVLRPVRVLNRYENGPRDCYKTSFRMSTTSGTADLISTVDHKLLTIKDCGPWATEKYGTARHAAAVTPVGKVPVRGTVYAKTSTGYDDAGHVDEPFALLLGLLLGNGRRTGGRKTGIRSAARRKLVELGVWGKYAHERTIPDVVHTWNNRSVAALLSGLVAADGSVCPVGANGAYVLRFSSTSRRMVEQVRYLMSVRFGVLPSSVSSYLKPKEGGGANRPQYSTAVGAWAAFQKMAAVLSVPGAKGAALKKAATAWPRGKKTQYTDRGRAAAREHVGTLPTYDIEVDHPDHLFVLENGLIVSNSEPATQSIIGCLSIGTMVRMADGSARSIESIRVGDYVLGSDNKARTFPVRVTHTFDNGPKECVRTTFSFGKRNEPVILDSTSDHKVLASTFKSGCKEESLNDVLRQLPVGTPAGKFFAAQPQQFVGGTDVDEPDDVRSTRCAVNVRVEKAFRVRRRTQDSIGVRQTYDIEVDHPDHLFVLANGLIVSNSKHSGGVAGATGAQQGFPVLDKLMSLPAAFGGAVHAETDGVLQSVRKAPQGGQYVSVGGTEHYIPPDRVVTAKHGDHIEAGDPLTDGLENPAKYVEHKGIGEARKRFVDAFMRASVAAGFRPHRRNLELVARGFLDHVAVEQETGEHVPGDVVSYTSLAYDYRPRPGHKVLAPKDAQGMYLERPALHHTIGTKVRPSVVRDLEEAGIDRIPVHPQPPPFTPVAIRSHDTLGHDPDPLTRMLGSGLEKTLLRGVARGDVSDLKGTSWVPPLAEGTALNTPDSKTKAWDPKEIKAPA